MGVIHRVACPLDCPDTCTLDVEVEGGRVQRVDAASSGERHPLQGDFICGKVRRIARHVHGEHRIAAPMVRVGAKGTGEFRRVTWDEALDRIAARYAEIARDPGPESLLPVSYGGSNGLLTEGAADALFFRRYGASRVVRNLCAGASSAAQRAIYGPMAGMALPDLEHSRAILLWGVNPHVTGIHMVPFVERAIERGAKLLVVDPRATPFARRADVHIALRPGSDLPVAMAVSRELFATGLADLDFLARHARGVDEFRRACEPWTPERAAAASGLRAEDITRLARTYGETRPAALRCGWGIERTRHGGAGTAAVLALPAIAGHFGVQGSGFAMSAGGAGWAGQLADPCDEPDRAKRVYHLSRLARELTDPAAAPVRALHVYNANPLATFPDQRRLARGLAREDVFTVVHDAVWTDTTRFADVVLPATTFLEQSDLARSYGAFALQYSRAAIPPVGEARTNREVFHALAMRLGLVREGESWDEERFLRNALAPRPGRIEPLLERGIVPPDAGYLPVAFRDLFPATPDRKIDLDPASLAASPGGKWGWSPENGAPLALISPAVAGTTSSTFAQLREGQVPLALHPDDARARGLTAGMRVRAYNELGEVHVVLELDPHLRPGVACLPKGLWAKHTLNGATSNALIPDHLTDVGEGACYNDARIEVEALV